MELIRVGRKRNKKMNTLTILDANTTIIPEGLYLELMNALKKDFDNNKIDIKSKLVYKLKGFIDALPNTSFSCFRCLEYLKEQCRDLNIIKSVFDDEFDMMYYDIEDDNIVYLEEGSDTDDSEIEINSDDDVWINECLCCKGTASGYGYEGGIDCETCCRSLCYKCDRNQCGKVNHHEEYNCWACDIKNFILN